MTTVRIYRISWTTYFRRLGIPIIAAIGGIGYFVYALLNLDTQTIIIFSIFGLTLLTIPFFTNAFTIKEICINENEIKYKHVLSNREYSISLINVSHFMYYNTPVEKYSYLPCLEIYTNRKFNQLNRKRIDLCLSKQDRHSFLSMLYDKGFQVTLFDNLRQIQETEYYEHNNGEI